MSAATEILSMEMPCIKTGIVTEIHHQSYVVDCEGSLFHAKLAFSCFVLPGVEDEVLVYLGPQKCLIVAITERDYVMPTKLSVAGDFDLDVQGNLFLNASGGTSISADERVRVQSKHVTTMAETIEVRGNDLDYQVKHLRLRFKSMEWLGDLVSRFAKRAVDRFEHYNRQVTGSEQVKSKRSQWTVDEGLQVNTKRTEFVSSLDTKILGSRVKVG